MTQQIIIRIQSLICLLFLLCMIVVAEYYTVNDGPTISNSHTVQFFYLEAPFPYNAPPNIVNTAGTNFDQFGVGHAGLGVWDTTSDVKFSIEFLSIDYVGSLLPKLQDGTITWENAGTIVITSPLVEKQWLNSRLITTATGNAYTQLITYLQDNGDEFFSVYQPVTALYVNASLFNSSTEYSNDDLHTIGSVVVPATNSFYFVDILIGLLGSYGTDLGAFLQIYATSFDYLTVNADTPGVVQWPVGETANPMVYQWFTDLNDCYDRIFQETQNNNQGALYFLDRVSTCYDSYAYFYNTPNSVYNVTLANYSVDYQTPMLNQYVYDLPDNELGNKPGINVMDGIMIALVFLAALYGVYYFLHKMFGKKQRRRVSFESERIAARTVENMTDNYDDELGHKAYFHGKNRGASFSANWSRAFPTGNMTMSSNPISAAPVASQVPNDEYSRDSLGQSGSTTNVLLGDNVA